MAIDPALIAKAMAASKAGGTAKLGDQIGLLRSTSPQRKAGDELERAADEIIGQLRDEAEFENVEGLKDLVYSLRERKAQVNNRWDSALAQAGLGREHLEHAGNIVGNDVQLVGSISARTPEAVELTWAPDTVSSEYRGRPQTQDVLTQTRLHSQFETNPLTGQQDVVPRLDASGVPMVTQFGRVGQSLSPADVSGMDTDEFLGQRIMELRGTPVVQNNDANAYSVDLVNPVTGEKVDVELLKSNQLARDGVGFQVYTEAAPASIASTRPMQGTPEESKAIAREMAKELKPMLAKEMSGGQSLQQAMSNLESEGLLTNSDGRYGPNAGKLLKEGGNYVDQIVYPVASDQDASLNLVTERQDGRRGLVMPLEGALLGDANLVKDQLATAGPELLEQLSVRPMPGNRGKFRPSAKVYVQEQPGSAAVQELDEAVRQLFRTQKKTSR